MNRGIARRTLFQVRGDMDCFLENLGEACGRFGVEVHAFCLMSTHYHLLVRSKEGRLAEAMGLVQTAYSRWFNRGRRRDGPLVRGRYRAKRADSITYLHAIVSYIDLNPVMAGLVRRAWDYPHGSARAYGGEKQVGWPGLCRGWVEEEVRRARGIANFSAAAYRDTFGGLPDELQRVIDARWRSRQSEDPLDELVRATPQRVREWLRRKALLADGAEFGLPVITSTSLSRAIEDVSREESRDWTIGRRNGWKVLRIGLIRQVCGHGLDEIAREVGLSRAAVSGAIDKHTELQRSDPDYEHRAATVLHLALEGWRVKERAWHRTAGSADGGRMRTLHSRA